ncbi:MAG: hypothetical protein LLG14_27510 [Nocardiaceae bacterium]|nr:hypothetical protein [Nocardiaceae bacterium]
MTKRVKATRFTKRFHLDETNPSSYIELEVRPGKHVIKLDRIEADVLNAHAGKSLACMNAVCAKREAAASKFPHLFYGIVFDTTMAYVIDKLTPGRQWARAVRYRHNDRSGVKMHDRLGPKKILALSKAEKTVTLSPPLTKPTRAGYKGQNGSSRAGMKTRLVVPMGARRRAIEAGLILVPTTN